MARRTQVFLRESVILFGFLSGLFLAIGVNPGAELLELLREIVENLFGGSGAIELAFTLAPLALVGIAFHLIWKRGGWLGFLAVALAFFAGLWLLAAPRRAAIVLVGALALGVVATR